MSGRAAHAQILPFMSLRSGDQSGGCDWASPMLQSIAMWAFSKSVLAGSLASAAPLLAFTLLMAIFSLPEGINGPGSMAATLWLAVLPLVVAFAIVITASIVIGLPATFVFRRKGWESSAAYVGVGSASGFLIPIIALSMMEMPGGYWMALLGAIGGAATGRMWWLSIRA